MSIMVNNHFQGSKMANDAKPSGQANDLITVEPATA